jgi:ABC-2 type transport system ATP-binding protein
MTSKDRRAAVHRRDDAGGVAWGADEVSVSFGKKVALDCVSLYALPGQVTAVVGGDGAGKSTLLRCLAGVLAPDSGVVHHPPKEATGYLPATSGIYPDLTVAENLDFRAQGYGMSRQAARERAREYLDRAGLTAASDRLAGQLSGGMRQKLAVIAAMLHHPDLIVLDEPTTGVDPVSRSGLWWLIARAAAEGCAIVLATTYLDDAERCASVLVLDSGTVLASGTAEKIIAAMPGSLRAMPTRPPSAAARSWRRAGMWRVWDPEPPASSGGTAVLAGGPAVPPGGAAGTADGEMVTPDLQDAVTVAAIASALGGAA